MASSIKRLSTGNEYVSIPDINTANGGIQCIGFVHRAFRASIELHGSKEAPLLKPLVEVDGEDLFEGGMRHDLLSFWIPSFEVASPRLKATSTVFAPLERRGFACVLTLQNTSDSVLTVRAGWKGCWRSSYHSANLSKQMSGTKHASISSWRPGVPIIEFRGHTPLFAMAMVSHNGVPATITDPDMHLRISEWTGESISAGAGSPIYYEMIDKYTLEPGQKVDVTVYVGIGLEEVSAIASAEELQMQGWDRMLASLRKWLDKHTIECDDTYFKRMINVNSFYNYFFSQATTLDTEELILATARSSRNESCASYWDRDAMRWSLPAVLQMNWEQARKMLIYAFTTQLPNVGIRSRFIDGIVLEPGLQLDQLCAPIRALDMYVEVTGDMSILFDRRVQAGVNTIQQILAAQRHPETVLFETLLLPSGEASAYPYVCFSNVLVWRSLVDIGRIYSRIRDIDRAEEANKLAIQVKTAVLDNFIVDGPLGKMYAHEIDLNGNHRLGDDPMGSLQLLSYFGFCTQGDQVYKNTVNWIHSEHNTMSGKGNTFEAPLTQDGSGPSVVGVIIDLLTGRSAQALDFLKRAELDDGIACATVDCETGIARNGMAFASCAGYLAFGLRTALNAVSPQTALIEKKKRPSEALYHPPPETSHDTRKARM
ncbi:MAG: glycoside hydrolase family 125 protein [Armatimonadota bacterium]|nr:glycoside hydrolase family 125 protein [bacterium]